MSPDPFRDLVDKRTKYSDVSEQFYEERLDRSDLSTADWPSQIDRAATDLLYGVAIGRTDSFDHGGTIGKMDFGRATGEYYVDGLIYLVGEHSDLPSLISTHKTTAIGEFAFALSKLRYDLANDVDSGICDVDRAIESIVEKLATQGITASTGRQPLHNPEAVVDIVHQLFSDPSASEYADGLLESLNKVSQRNGGVDLMAYLDMPQMVTPLWDHQQTALANWCKAGYAGYVNMATATGKTVLGLAAIAHLFGELHPHDANELPDGGTTDTDVSILVVAGQELLLEQWQSEFDEHLNIPRDRTRSGEERTIELTWGSVDFRTAQGLLGADVISGYDLVILDEAHRYRSRGSDGRSWRNLFDSLTARSDALLAMSGSIDQDWIGDTNAKEALEENLTECAKFSISDAREANVIADFSWEVLYAASADDETLSGVAESTEPLDEVYDRTNHKFLTGELKQRPDDFPETFETLRDLRSFAQSNDGSQARGQSEVFDRLATAAFSRRPRRWQLHPPRETIRQLVLRHAEDSKRIVLVQSYQQAEHVAEMLRAELGDKVVEIQNGDTTSQTEQIDRFKTQDGGVIVGPGDVIGVGVDIPDADVAINLAKGGVNASLIQRIGRVLRNPTGDGRSHFYQVVTLPKTPAARLAGEDGRRLLRRAAEFRALGSRFRELPGFGAPDDTSASILAELEIAGSLATSADHRTVEEMVADDVAQEWLHELLDAVSNRDQATDPVLPDVWVGETVDPSVEPIKTALKSRAQRRNGGDDSNERRSNANDSEANTDADRITISVTVDNEEQNRLGNASVELSTTESQWISETTTDGSHRFEIPKHSRQFTVSVTAPGYESYELMSLLNGKSGPIEVDVELQRSQTSLEGTSTNEAETTTEATIGSDSISAEKGELSADGTENQTDKSTADIEIDEPERTTSTSTDTDGQATISPAELTELYEVFRSLSTTIGALITESAVEEGPMVDWHEALRSFLESGCDGWEAGYGPQQADRSPITAQTYREQFGDGDRVTTYQEITTVEPDTFVKEMCQVLGGVSDVTVPVAPSEETPVPIVVESAADLRRAQSLLATFPETPRAGGQPASNEEDEPGLTSVSGVTEADAEVLREAGFETVADLREAPYEAISELAAIPDHLALRIKADVE
ncbi:DEAD/DEAH box helicase family protein [Natronocalculus amylovorans]|uniref:DEAD/DEAH box helicase family protein n=1 Tax=Natronocalculus amylovorans TaxID=2917812 RepID=A0AAE3K8Y1_9EURY|nr:DEAD/DEAH box helicase family protein [Natronocalculus amylovorans]MCL9817782.1 DEAD/DEAH box helicase family protein [Natronocalculus amylovorans]